MTRRHNRVASILAGLTLSVLAASTVQAGTLKLSWTPPTEREDGTPLAPSEIAGYKIYYGTTLGNYDGTDATQGISPIDVPITGLATPLTPSYLVTGLTTCEVKYIVMTTYDTDGAESRFSMEVAKPALDAPVVSTPQSAGPGALQISWTGPPAGDTGSVQSYNVYYDTDAGDPYQGVGAIQGSAPINVAGNVLSMQLTGLPPSANYYLAVEATCPNGTTNLSDEVSGTTGAVIPQPDTGVPPPPADAGVPTLPPDQGVTPPPPGYDQGVAPPPPGYDQGVPSSWPDAGLPPPTYNDAGVEVPTPWPDSGTSGLQNNNSLTGGCTVGATPSALPLLLLLALLVLRRPRD